jgi:hypothetical protein
MLGAYIRLMYTAIAAENVDALSRTTRALIALGRNGVPPLLRCFVHALLTQYVDPHNEGVFIFIDDFREGVDKVLAAW